MNEEISLRNVGLWLLLKNESMSPHWNPHGNSRLRDWTVPLNGMFVLRFVFNILDPHDSRASLVSSRKLCFVWCVCASLSLGSAGVG